MDLRDLVLWLERQVEWDNLPFHVARQAFNLLAGLYFWAWVEDTQAQ